MAGPFSILLSCSKTRAAFCRFPESARSVHFYREVFFFAGDFFFDAAFFRGAAAFFFAADFFEVADFFEAADFFEVADFFEAPFFGGTFPPAFRASDKPIAMACFRFFTVFPLRPLLSCPRFSSCSAFSTLFFDFCPYFAMIKWVGSISQSQFLCRAHSGIPFE